MLKPVDIIAFVCLIVVLSFVVSMSVDKLMRVFGG